MIKEKQRLRNNLKKNIKVRQKTNVQVHIQFDEGTDKHFLYYYFVSGQEKHWKT